MNTILSLNRNFQNWWRYFIIFAVVAISAGLAYRGGRLAALVFLAVPFILITLILLRKPQWGLIALFPIALLVPFELATGEVSTINITVLLVLFLLGLWLLEMVVNKHSISIIPTRSIKILLLFSIIVLLSLLMGFLPWFGDLRGAPLTAQLAGAVLFFLSFGAFLLVAHQIKEIRWLEWMVWVFLALSGLYLVTHRISVLGDPLGSLFQYTATRGVFWNWLAALAFSQALLNKKISRFWRLLLLGLTFLTLYLGLFTYRNWVSGWLPPLVAIIGILYLSKPRLALVITAVLVPVIIFNWQEINQAVLYTGGEYTRNWWSLVSRQEAWKIVLDNIVSKNPFLGVGPANYYYYVVNYSLYGYFVPFNSHNQYIDILAQTGGMGLLCFILFILEMFRTGFRSVPRLTNPFSQAYTVGVLGGMAGMLVSGFLADWIIPFVYNVGLYGFRASVLSWLFMGGLVVIDRLDTDNGQQ